MSISNNELLMKVDMPLATLASSGLMNPEQADTFIRMMQNTPTILRDARVVPMASDTRKVEKLGFGTRILRPGQEGTIILKV